jgi:class 3 adenylate cyclase/tetratricopeptide (TPR) repeat protein/DNA-binding XRE family transcriptional regulator
MTHSNRPWSTDWSFGDVLRTLRNAAGLTQAELAELARLSTRGISDLERGVNHRPQRETLLALTDALKLDEEERYHFFEAAGIQLPASLVPSSPSPFTEAKPRPASSIETSDPVGPRNQASAIHSFLIADVRGYTSYTDEHHDEDAAQLTMRFAAVARAAAQEHGGQVVEERGDEVLAVFTSARAALRAAILLQERASETSHATPEHPIRCGVGVEAGEAVPIPGGYRGLAINLAARLCAQAGPGEVLAGEMAIGLARKVAGLVFRDRGPSVLKGISKPVRITQVLAAEIATPETPISSSTEPHRASVGNFLSAQPEHRLVAREGEMAILLDTLDAALDRTGQFVLVVGELGVGKTRLAQEVLQAAQKRGFGVISGRCYAPQETVPYYPFLEALAQAYAVAPPAIRSALPTQWPEVARLIPDRSLGGLAAMSPGGVGAEDQQRLFWQVTRFLQALAVERPLVLALDDLHWMDGASLDLLLHLARHTRDCPVVVLGTCRDSEVAWRHPLARGVSDLSRAHLVKRMELRQLSQAGIAALLESTLEAGEVSEAVTDLIYKATEGNAFFAQEVVRVLLERGDITLQGGSWQPRPDSDLAVPESVRSAVLERVARLSPTAQEILVLASVLGQTFHFDGLLALAMPAGSPEGLETAQSSSDELESTLDAALEEAVESQILREVSSSQYAFSHVLTQRALYGQLSARRRRRLHRAVAETIELMPEAERVLRAADIAYHFLQAEENARALPYALQLGKQAQTVYAYPESERQFRTALALARQIGDEDAEYVAQQQLGWALLDQSRWDEAFAVLEQTVIEAERRGDLASLVRLTRLLGGVDTQWGATAEGIARLLRLIETTQSGGESPELAQLYISLANQYWASGQYAEGLGTAERALQVAQAVGDIGLVALARVKRGVAFATVGRLEEALLEIRTALPVLQGRQDRESLENRRLALGNLGYVLTLLGQIGEAQDHYGRALALSEQLGSTDDALAELSAICSLIAFVHGDWALAWGYVERGLALQSHIDADSSQGAMLYEVAGRLQLAQGQLAAAVQSAEASLALAERTLHLPRLRAAQRLLAELDLKNGEPAAAHSRLVPLLDRAGLVELDVNGLLPLVACAQLELGDVVAAEALATQTVARMRSQHDRFHLVDALQVEAAVRIRQQRWNDAEARLDEALALARSMPYPYAEAKALATFGDLHLAGGEPERAHDQYEAALAILRSLGEVTCAEQIQRTLHGISRRQ